jgi:hypothetical protein
MTISLLIRIVGPEAIQPTSYTSHYLSSHCFPICIDANMQPCTDLLWSVVAESYGCGFLPSLTSRAELARYLLYYIKVEFMLGVTLVYTLHIGSKYWKPPYPMTIKYGRHLHPTMCQSEICGKNYNLTIWNYVVHMAPWARPNER